MSWWSEGSRTGGKPAADGRFARRVLAVLAVVLMVAACAAPQTRPASGSRGVGRPPPEQAPVVYSNQNRSGSLISADNDPFAAR